MTHDRQVLLALLVMGHVLADFAFQPRAMVEGKLNWRMSAFARHTSVVLALQAATLLPVYPGWQNVRLVIGMAGVHLVTDAMKTALSRTWPRMLTWFVLDQVIHVAVLLAVASQVDITSRAIPTDMLDPVHVATILVTTLLFQASGGSVIVSLVLSDLRSDQDSSPAAPVPLAPPRAEPIADPAAGDARGAGQRIGVLERWLITLAVAHGQWAAVGLVLTAKSIARFKELEDKTFSEVYLVGTMTSVLVAIAGGLFLAHLVPQTAT